VPKEGTVDLMIKPISVPKVRAATVARIRVVSAVFTAVL
jgi:hypothetical protein